MNRLLNTIKGRLTLAYMLASSVVVVVIGGLLVWQDQQQRRLFLEDRINSQARVVASNIAAAILFKDQRGTEEVLQALADEPALINARAEDGDGKIIAELNRTTDSSNDTVYVEAPILDLGERIGSVYVSASKTELSLALRRSLAQVALISGLALLIGLLVSRRSQSGIVGALEALSGIVHSVMNSGDYSLRATPQNPEEIRQLTVDINAMLKMIDNRDRDLANAVEQRTADLAQRNEQLDSQIRLREAADKSLKASQEQFRRAFDDAPIGMALVDTQFRIVRRNLVFAGMASLTDDTAPPDLLALINPDNRAAIEKGFSQLMAGSRSVFEVEAQCFGESLTDAWCILSFSAVIADDNDFMYSVLQLQDITEAKRLSENLEFQALHDELTGLNNRRAFDAALRQLDLLTESKKSRYSLMLLDMDQFKIVNDTCGHAAGDKLLQRVAKAIKQKVRPDDLVVRLGGDEFALVLYDCALDKAKKVAEKIRHSVEQLSFSWEKKHFRVTLSIGVAEGRAGETRSSDVLRNVDSACFSAKDLGRNRVYAVQGSDALIEQKQGEMQWIHRLDAAIQQDDLLLFAQRVLPVNDQGEPPRFEILVRLRDRKTKRIVPPGAFLAAAERYGLVSKVDRWVVNTLIKSLKVYRDVFDEDARYWVNLSGKSINNAKFVSFLEQAISSSELPSGMINFEITETEVIENIREAATFMESMKALGCEFALDDFGAGLSSFGYLKGLPVDYVKIDGMFIRDIAHDDVDRIFVKSIIDITRAMGIRSVAEFVESSEVLDILRELGADFAQGFAIGRPEPLVPTLARDISETALLVSQSN